MSSEPLDIVGSFNQYFSTIEGSLVSKFDKNLNFLNYLSDNVDSRVGLIGSYLIGPNGFFKKKKQVEKTHGFLGFFVFFHNYCYKFI